MRIRMTQLLVGRTSDEIARAELEEVVEQVTTANMNEQGEIALAELEEVAEQVAAANMNEQVVGGEEDEIAFAEVE